MAALTAWSLTEQLESILTRWNRLQNLDEQPMAIRPKIDLCARSVEIEGKGDSVYSVYRDVRGHLCNHEMVPATLVQRETRAEQLE
jgi:hypothetical protein